MCPLVSLLGTDIDNADEIPVLRYAEITALKNLLG